MKYWNCSCPEVAVRIPINLRIWEMSILKPERPSIVYSGNSKGGIRKRLIKYMQSVDDPEEIRGLSGILNRLYGRVEEDEAVNRADKDQGLL